MLSPPVSLGWIRAGIGAIALIKISKPSPSLGLSYEPSPGMLARNIEMISTNGNAIFKTQAHLTTIKEFGPALKYKIESAA